MSDQNPTVVFVHGAFAESSSWNGVIEQLYAAGITSVAVANPLRSISGDAAYVRDVIASIDGPVVLVGHSYGGLVISEARPEVAVYYRGQPEKEFRHRRVASDNDYLLMENFAQAIDTDGDTILDARAGRAISGVVEAALTSARTGKVVALESE